jgi:hypothetical protein
MLEDDGVSVVNPMTMSDIGYEKIWEEHSQVS